MCVGIPARIVQLETSGPHSARVDVEGVQREVNTMLVDGDDLVVDDWVLLHVGFAMAKIDEAEAQETLRFLRHVGALYDEEVDALRGSDRIENTASSADDR